MVSSKVAIEITGCVDESSIIISWVSPNLDFREKKGGGLPEYGRDNLPACIGL